MTRSRFFFFFEKVRWNGKDFLDNYPLSHGICGCPVEKERNALFIWMGDWKDLFVLFTRAGFFLPLKKEEG